MGGEFERDGTRPFSLHNPCKRRVRLGSFGQNLPWLSGRVRLAKFGVVPTPHRARPLKIRFGKTDVVGFVRPKFLAAFAGHANRHRLGHVISESRFKCKSI
jgi:hypothetical protein